MLSNQEETHEIWDQYKYSIDQRYKLTIIFV